MLIVKFRGLIDKIIQVLSTIQGARIFISLFVIISCLISCIGLSQLHGVGFSRCQQCFLVKCL